ncbi:MAG: carboxypeptidase-like regulatory domain-containing protein [Candidatus Thermoplasmatota archaeon]|nr:carboxypeptidase-like regulatory domain-containing protein [Candidatus Thermoplasmatota archaeon]
MPFGYNQVLYNFSAVPANQIAGQVLLNSNQNTPDANQWVSICHVLGERSTSSGETICTETYHVKTNSHGEYRFFANCNTGYGISANISTPFGDSCHTNSITTGAAGGTTFDNFSLYLSNVNGKVTNSNNGKPISGADVTFTSSGGTSYTVSTNDTGGYSLNIANNGTYTITASSAGYISSSVSPTLSDNTLTHNFLLTPAGTVNFDESGLHGNTWSVTLDGQSVQSTSSQISFEVAYGSYSYSIGSVSGYSSSPSSGSVTSGSSSVTQDISFSPTSYYGVTFDKSGLPSGHTWSVTMGGTTNSASTGSSIGFSEPNGYFSYSPSRLLVPVPDKPGYYYDYHASGGTAHVNGPAQTIDISYSHTIVHYCVNATAEILLANNTYDRAANITDGTFLMTYNTTTGTMQKGEVTSVLSVNESSLYTINNNLEVSGDQPILTSNGWVNASSLHKGELVFNPITGSFVDIYSLHHSQKTETMYDFIISGNDNYIAYTYLLQGV